MPRRLVKEAPKTWPAAGGGPLGMAMESGVKRRKKDALIAKNMGIYVSFCVVLFMYACMFTDNRWFVISKLVWKWLIIHSIVSLMG